MTELLFRADPYLRDCEARVVAVNARGGVILDRTVFYAMAGGQPGDTGTLEVPGIGALPVATTVYDDGKAIVHVIDAAGAAAMPEPGAVARAALDWERRYRHMRVHTALHLLCALVRFPVTGGQIAADGGRLDFDIADPSAVSRDRIEGEINRLIAEDHPVCEQWISDAELAANPGRSAPCRSCRPPAPDRCASCRSARVGASIFSLAAAPMCVGPAKSAASPSASPRARASRTGASA